jgi:cyclic nucleotide gated channel beta 1
LNLPKRTKFKRAIQTIRQKLEFVDPRGYVNIAWLSLLATIFLFNAWVIPLRSTFPFATTSKHHVFWFLLDYLGDFICWLDIFFYKPRLM